MFEDNKAIARSYMEECWNRGDVARLDEVVAKNCRFHDPVFPTLASGLENLKNHVSSCRTGFPDLRFTIDDVIAERNEVVIHWTARGTHKGSFLGMAPTNRTGTVSGTDIYRIEGGKIVEMWSDWNLLTLLEQLGLAAPQKTEAAVRKSV